MVPMVTIVDEFRAARGLLDLEMQRACGRGNALPASLAVGAMIEVPTALLAVETIARDADFLSVGRNDLHQFLYAADRGGERVAGRYDVLDPLFLSGLQRIVLSGGAPGTPAARFGALAEKRPAAGG